MSKNLTGWMKEINELHEEEQDDFSDYVPFLINRCLSYYPDTIYQANDMNMFTNIPKEIQYQYYINTVEKRKRFSPWAKRDVEMDNICNKLISVLHVSKKQAKDIFKTLDDSEVEELKNLEIYGV